MSNLHKEICVLPHEVFMAQKFYGNLQKSGIPRCCVIWQKRLCYCISNASGTIRMKSAPTGSNRLRPRKCNIYVGTSYSWLLENQLFRKMHHLLKISIRNARRFDVTSDDCECGFYSATLGGISSIEFHSGNIRTEVNKSYKGGLMLDGTQF